MALHQHTRSSGPPSPGAAEARRWAERAGKLRLFVSRYRRTGAAVLVAAAVACGLTVLRPPAPDRVEVLAAATDLAGGTRLSASDLATLALRPDTVPAGALRPHTDVSGRILAGPMRAGEPLTDAALVGAPLLAKRKLVAAPVRIADPGVARLLEAGDRIDVLAAATRGAMLAKPAVRVATGVRVLAVPRRDGNRITGSGVAGGAVIVLATTPDQAAELAGAAVSSRLTVTLRSRQ